MRPELVYRRLYKKRLLVRHERTTLQHVSTKPLNKSMFM